MSMLLLAAGCDKVPEFVHVLESPQSLELVASASVTRIVRGESVVLHVTRRTSGVWRRIPMTSLATDQCWMQRPPPDYEAEVADNVRWDVTPAGPAWFNTDFRSDHTRLVVFADAGEYLLTPNTSVWCEPGRAVAAQAIRIEVAAK